MTTIADELLNDFEDSGSEQEEDQNDAFPGNGETSSGHLDAVSSEPAFANRIDAMELDDGEEEQGDADFDGTAPSHLKQEDAEDEEETKARVEKMELKTVSDVRSVAGLMKQLEPVLEVSQKPNSSLSVSVSFTSSLYSILTFRSLAEDRTLQEPASRSADKECWQRRGQSRVQASHTIEHPFDQHRWRDHIGTQVYPRSLLRALSRARDTHPEPLGVRQDGEHHRQRPYGKHSGN